MKNTNDRTITAINHTVGNSKFCSKAEALDYARTCGNRHGWVALCKRQDVTPEEAIMYVKESNYWILWCDLLRRTDVLEYLNGLSSREAIAFAKKVQEERIWKIVLSREDVSPVLAISLARSIVPCWGRGPISDWRESDPSVWESVLARTDVPLREAVFHATNFTKLNATELWVK
jgi:hypothetical protein